MSKLTKDSRIYVAGHRGMVGSAIMRKLQTEGYTQLITASSSELDLRNQQATEAFMAKHRPDVVIIAAARVGGILANNSYPWQFLYDNLMIEANLIKAAHECDVNNLIFLGSSCIYPKQAPQPLKESYLLTGPLEPTNEWYAVAKITGIKMCQALNKQYGRSYLSLMPTNLYGPEDNFDLKTSHVLPAMIRKFHEAAQDAHKPVLLWGSGSPMREFLHVDDLANATYYFMKNDVSSEFDLINIGTGTDITIKQLAELIQQVTGHQGEIVWDSSKPDGTPRKLMDVSRADHLGWRAEIQLEDGIRETYTWFRTNFETIKELKVIH